MREVIRQIVLLAAVVATLGLTACSQSSPDAVVLIVLDTARPDRFSAYGERLYKTPHVDSLAADGVLFKHAYSTSGWSLPTMGAMMTSRYPTQLGLIQSPVENEAAIEWNQLRDQTAHTLPTGESTLAETLRAAGYSTAAFVNQPFLNLGSGFSQGFDSYWYPRNEESLALLDSSGIIRQSDVPRILENALSVDNLLVGEFDRWLIDHRRERVFVWIHLLTPHPPYLPPPWSERRTARTKGRFETPGPSDHYDGELIAADELVGRIVNLIDARFGPENSVIAFVSDNAEAFGEHGTNGHGHNLRSEVIHVPLILRAPAAPAGAVVDSPVGTIDILPTLLDLTGVASNTPAAIEGETQMPLFRADVPELQRELYLEGVLFGPSSRALLVGGKKVVWDGATDSVRVYEYLREPEEVVDIGSARPALADSLAARLKAIHRRLTADRHSGASSAGDASEFRSVAEAMGYPEAAADPPVAPPASNDSGHDHRH